MELKIRDLVKAKDAMMTLGATKGLKSITIFKIARDIQKMNEYLDPYNDAVRSLVDRYGKKDEEGNQMYNVDGNALFDKANIDIVNEEIESLQEQTADIELQTVTPDEIEKADLTAFDIINIGFLLEEEE